MNLLDHNDPRLTAYALGEMPAAERHDFEQLLASDAAARQAVAEIRETAAALNAALEHEPAVPVAAAKPKPDPYAKVVRFPYWQISGLAAACFAVFFVYWQARQPVMKMEQKRYVEVNLPVAAAAEMHDAVTAQSKAKKEVEPQGALAQRSVSQGQSLKDEVIELSPFKVEAEVNVGYMAGNTLSGSRISAAPPAMISGRGAVPAARLSAQAPRDVSNTEAYAYRKDNDFARVADEPLSTFSIDVDTAAYANVRRFLTQGQRPPVDAVRIEEFVNYFSYEYAGPDSKSDVPFKANLEVASAPWAPEHRLVRIGLKGREVSDAARPAANLVFLLDVSGSMNEPNKLPLLKQSLRLLVEKLRPDDRVAIAVYAGASGMALPSTTVAHKAEILAAIDRLQAEGSTNGAMGIHLAYDIAKANLIPGGVNRVLLATDGDFNVGVTSEGELVRLIEEKAKSGVFLSVLGFGRGNLKDSTMEQLADKGNGNYAYIDTLQEAKKALVEQAGGTLVTIAKDVKIQVEFNPAQVSAYRLIGYENRVLAKEDFNNDQIDAGEIGAGHTVTALYEVVPAGVVLAESAPTVDALKYQTVQTPNSQFQIPNANSPRPTSSEMLTVKIRYKEPAGDVSSKLEFPLRDEGRAFAEASHDFKFAAAVASFGMILRDSPYKGSASLAEVAAWSRAGVGRDAGGYRTEFLGLVDRAQAVVR